MYVGLDYSRCGTHVLLSPSAYQHTFLNGTLKLVCHRGCYPIPPTLHLSMDFLPKLYVLSTSMASAAILLQHLTSDSPTLSHLQLQQLIVHRSVLSEPLNLSMF